MGFHTFNILCVRSAAVRGIYPKFFSQRSQRHRGRRNFYAEKISVAVIDSFAVLYCFHKMIYTKYLEFIMEVKYTYWEDEDGLFIGYLKDYPDHLTQGHDLAELEEMLADVYQIRQDEEKRLAQKLKNGVLRITVPA